MNNMTPDPQPEMGTTTNAFVAAPAEPKYEHQETGRLLQEAARCPHDVTIPTWDTVGLFAAQLARADERVRELEQEREQLLKVRELFLAWDTSPCRIESVDLLDNVRIAALTRQEE